MTTKNDIREWLNDAESHHTHMLVICDTWDYDDYPHYTDKISESIERFTGESMQKIMEVYDLSKDHEGQLDANRVWNIS